VQDNPLDELLKKPLRPRRIPRGGSFEDLLEGEYRPRERPPSIERAMRGVSRATRVFGPIGAIIGLGFPSELGSGEVAPEELRKRVEKTTPRTKTKAQRSPPDVPPLPPKPDRPTPVPVPRPPAIPSPDPARPPDGISPGPVVEVPEVRPEPVKRPESAPSPVSRTPRPATRKAPTTDPEPILRELARLFRRRLPRNLPRNLTDQFRRLAPELAPQPEPEITNTPENDKQPQPAPSPDLTPINAPSAKSPPNDCRCDDGRKGKRRRPSNVIADVKVFKRRMSQNSLDNLRRGTR